MERLTERDTNGHWRVRGFTEVLPAYWQACNRLAAYEDTGLEPEEVRSLRIDMAIIKAMFGDADVKRMKELCEADKEGRVVVLPCKVGDTVYRPQLAESVPLKEMVCCGYRIYEGGINVMCKESGIEFPLIFTLGKTAYLTRAEAEAAIGGGQT